MARPNEYARQQERARALGYSSYYEERKARATARGFTGPSQQTKERASPTFQRIEDRFRALGLNRDQSITRARSITINTKSRGEVVKRAMQQRLYASGDEAAYELYGSQGE